MVKSFAAVLLLIALLAVIPGPHEVSIDTSRSSAHFSVQHIWVERVTGTVPILGGTVTVQPGSLIPESASAVLDATQIQTGEPDRDKSLESSDFFDAANFPHWTFASTRVVVKGPSAFEMDGDLTIHGVAQPETLIVTLGGTPEHPVYHAQASINRHAFGMARTRLDPTIGEVVDVALDITLK